MTESTFAELALEHQKAGRLSEAAELYRQALSAGPANPKLLASLGDILQTQGRLDEAIMAYQQAIELDARFQPAWYPLGCAWQKKNEDAAAAECFSKAIELVPDHAPSQHNLGKALFRLGLIDEAIARFRVSLSLGGGFLPHTAIATSIPGSPKADHDAILQARRSWAEKHLPACDSGKKFQRQAPNGRPLRIGYLSSFFHQRNWMKPVWGLINHHDRDQVRVLLFSDAPESACTGGYSREPADEFHDISNLSNVGAVEHIAACDVDILVDLNSYSHISRLALVALKPASILVAWFNLYATSGMPCYDYIVGDAHVILPEEEPFYTEKVLRLRGSYLTFEVSYPVPDVVPPPALNRSGLTFGCFASQYKITPQVIEAWAAILGRSPKATLLLKNSTLGSPANRDFLYRRFERHGIGRRQIEMEGPSEHFDFLGAYGKIDIALDTFPYNGGTTTSEALWQGVPVLTYRGDRWAARQSTSLLTEAGLQEFVATDRHQYIEYAVSLAQGPNSPAYLAELRSSMRSRLAKSSLCDARALAQDMEGLYRQIFDHWWRQNSF